MTPKLIDLLSDAALAAWNEYEVAVKERIRLNARPYPGTAALYQAQTDENVAHGRECRRLWEVFYPLALASSLDHYQAMRMRSQCYWDHRAPRGLPMY